MMKMISSKFVFCFVLLPLFFFCVHSCAAGELGRLARLPGLRLNIEHSSYFNVLSHKEASFLSEGGQYATYLTLSDREQIFGNYEIGFNLSARITGDKSVDRNTLSLQNLLILFTSPGLYGMEFGNIYSTFSSYTLGQSLEGLNYWQELPWFRLKVTGGRHYRPADANQFTRYTAGLRTERNFTDSTFVGLNLVKTWDDRTSLTAGDTLTSIDNFTTSIEAKWKGEIGMLKDIDARSEFAYSCLQEDQGTSGGVQPAGAGPAYKIDSSARWENLFISAGFEYVGTRFQPACGSASQDQERFYINSLYRHSPSLSLRGGYSEYHNNLENTLLTTSRTKAPSLNISFMREIGPGHLNTDLSYRLTARQTSAAVRDDLQHSGNISAGYTFRYYSISISEAHSWLENKINPAYSKDSNLVSINLSASRLLFWNKQIDLSPRIIYSFQNENSSSGIDKYQNLQIGFNLGYKESTSLLLSCNLSQNDRAVANADSLSSNWQASLTYNPSFLNWMNLSLQYHNRSSNYEDPARNYGEESVQFRLYLSL